MTVRVLVVDDSGFFRRRIRGMLEQHAEIKVVGEAGNGLEAIAEVERLHPDVVTMDVEMPELDGISAVREIMRRRPTPVVMFSSLTYQGARATLKALDAGATDFLPKRFADISADTEAAKRQLQDRVLALGRQRALRTAPLSSQASHEVPTASAAKPEPRARAQAGAYRPGRFDLVVIGTSTGGPIALQQVLTRLLGNFPLPIVLIQHMPASFTPAFAERLNELCSIGVAEAKDGAVLRPGLALLAPGGKQLGLKRAGSELSVRIFDAGPEQFYKPSVDIAFSEAARSCPGKVLGIVLTGMGADGCQGARLLKQTGSCVWAQDEASSVIYGMPAAVAKAGLADRVLALNAVGPELARIR